MMMKHEAYTVKALLVDGRITEWASVNYLPMAQAIARTANAETFIAGVWVEIYTKRG